VTTVLAIDIGTSVTRASAVTLDGVVVAAASARSAASVAGNKATANTHALWADLCGLIADVVAHAGRPLAVGVAAQLGTVLADKALEPVGEALLWQDRRAASEAAELADLLTGRAYELAGRGSAAELTAPRLMWMARHQPAEWDRARWCLSLKDYIVARLTGTVATDPTSASYSLLFDVRRRMWSDELAAAANVPVDRLPPVLAAFEACGTISERAAAPTGLAPGIPVAVGGPDGTVGVLGAGAGEAGITVDVAGTTDVILHTTDRPVNDPSQRTALSAYLLPGLWTVGGPTGLTGGAVAWLSALLGHSSVDRTYRELGVALATIEPGAAGLSFHTALSGERFPTWASDRAGSLSGIRPEHTPAHVLRAAEEGAAFTVRRGLEALEALDLPVGEIRVSGGLAKSEEAMRLRANALGRAVVGASASDATTIGSAVLAAICAGVYDRADQAIDAMVRVEPAVVPDPTTTAAYDAAYRRWHEAAPTT
jgi:sugar (pentulose or hexulose) kinase